MVGANESRRLARGLGDDGCSAMAASVVEGADLAVFAVDEKDGLSSILPQLETSRLWELVNMSREEPTLTPEVLLLEIVEALVRITPTREVREMGESLGRGVSICFVLHQSVQVPDVDRVHVDVPPKYER